MFLQAAGTESLILGPFLFEIFVNDLFSTFLTSNYMIHPDDSQIYHYCLPSNIFHSVGLNEHDAQAVADEAIKNGLDLNLNRSKFVFLGSKSYTSIPELDIHLLCPILINSTPLQYHQLIKNPKESRSLAPSCPESVTACQQNS